VDFLETHLTKSAVLAGIVHSNWEGAINITGNIRRAAGSVDSEGRDRRKDNSCRLSNDMATYQL